MSNLNYNELLFINCKKWKFNNPIFLILIGSLIFSLKYVNGSINELNFLIKEVKEKETLISELWEKVQQRLLNSEKRIAEMKKNLKNFRNLKIK